jgi:pimeloyl-ACP methyl ester carboxylesterase
MTPSSYLNRNGLDLAVYSCGTQGLPLVFQHGLCGDAKQIAEAMSALAPQRWTGLECPGHGISPMAMPSIAGFADNVAALIETLGQPVVLGGISMGAAIASRLAVTRPNLLRGLVLVRPAWVCEAAPANMRPNAEVGSLLAQHPAQQARAIFAASPTAQHLAQQAPDNLASLMGFFNRSPQSDTAHLLTNISADGPDISEADLRKLSLPTLICGCDQDAIHPFAHAEKLASLIPDARLVKLPAKAQDKAAHLAAFAKTMTQFLQEISNAAPK